MQNSLSYIFVTANLPLTRVCEEENFFLVASSRRYAILSFPCLYSLIKRGNSFSYCEISIWNETFGTVERTCHRGLELPRLFLVTKGRETIVGFCPNVKKKKKETGKREKRNRWFFFLEKLWTFGGNWKGFGPLVNACFKEKASMSN